MKYEPGGGRYKGVGNVLQCGGPVVVFVWGGDVGPHPEDGAGPGKFSILVTRKQPWRPRMAGIWEYPPLAEALREAEFEGIMKSVTRTQNTIA